MRPELVAVWSLGALLIAGAVAWWICFLVGVYPPPESRCNRWAALERSAIVPVQWRLAWKDQPSPRQLRDLKVTTEGWRLNVDPTPVTLDHRRRVWSWGSEGEPLTLDWTPEQRHQLPLIAGPWLQSTLQVRIVEWEWEDDAGVRERVVQGVHEVWQEDQWMAVNLEPLEWRNVPLAAPYVNLSLWGQQPLSLQWSWHRGLLDQSLPTSTMVVQK